MYIYLSWWKTHACSLASDRHIACFSFFLSGNIFAILYGRIENSIKTLPKKTHLAKAGPSYLSAWNLRKRKTKVQWCKIISVHVYFMLPRLWLNLVKVPQSGSGCRLPLRHWGLSAQICCAVTFPGLHLHSLQSGSVGQCSVCVFVWVSVLFWSAGIWCPAGYGKWMVAQLAMGLMVVFFVFFQEGLHTGRRNYSTRIPLKKKKKKLCMCVSYNQFHILLYFITCRPKRVSGAWALHNKPCSPTCILTETNALASPLRLEWLPIWQLFIVLLTARCPPRNLKWNATINVSLGTKNGFGLHCIATHETAETSAALKAL